MTTESAADRAQFFDTDEFAVSATYGASTINVVFDNAWIEDGPGTAGIASRRAMVLALELDMPSVAAGQTLIIGGTTYTIVEVHPDGAGMLSLQLNT